MVFGNSGDNSGTGVAFTRNPATGEKALFGEYLINAQGEDVVAGVRTPSPISKLHEEMPAVYELLTVAEHLEFIRRAWRMEDDGYGEELLERLELADKRDKLGRELSKGMQQKLSIACAMVHRPDVLIFDEPLVGLDPHAIKELKNIFRELRADGRAVLISTHMIDSVEDYWDVAHIMMNGEFAATKRADEAGGRDLEELFFAITEGGEQA